MIENGIARFEIAQKIDEGNVIGLRARERAHNEVEISSGKPRPTIRSDHRELVMRKGCVYGKPNIDCRCVPAEYRHLACAARGLPGLRG
jgi:hypothetical protein